MATAIELSTLSRSSHAIRVASYPLILYRKSEPATWLGGRLYIEWYAKHDRPPDMVKQCLLPSQCPDCRTISCVFVSTALLHTCNVSFKAPLSMCELLTDRPGNAKWNSPWYIVGYRNITNCRLEVGNGNRLKRRWIWGMDRWLHQRNIYEILSSIHVITTSEYKPSQ